MLRTSRSASRTRLLIAFVATLFTVSIFLYKPIRSALALGGGSGSISLTTLGSAYLQDFNTLANSGTTNNLTINGWFLNEAGTAAANNGQYAAGTGSGNTGDVYSFGAAASAERAFGTLLSGTLTPTIGAQFTNNTGSTVTALDVSYIGEMWRLGQNTVGRAADRLDFQLSTNATSLTTGTWTDYNSLDFSSPVVAGTVGALNGNAAGNQTPVSFSITGLSIANGATFWIRWNDFDIAPGADDGLAIDTFSLTPRIVDFPPEVTSTFPVNGATDFPVNANLTVTFSEPVNVTASPSWFTLQCSTSGTVATTYSGGPTTFTLDPAVSLVHGEACTLTVLASQVTDQDANDPPDNMVFNFVVGFSPFDACAAAYIPTYTIQGSGLTSPLVGTPLSTRGVVVGDFETTAGQQGFYLQDLTGDGDSATSDGIFVFTGSANLVSAGQVVRVTGTVRERFDQTSITGGTATTPVAAGNITSCGTGSVTPTDVTMPFATADYPERYEGMLVNLPQQLVISEYFNFERFGEMVIALPLPGETRPFTGTAIDEPGAPALAREEANSLRRITLDDTLGTQNPPTLRHPNGLTFDLSNRFRGGDTVQNTVGVLGYDFGLYRIQPTGPATYLALNPRPAAPEPVGGTVRVAAMNTLNFFVTANYPTGNPLDNKCGPSNTLECRGWDSDQANEFTRQRDKLLTALTGLDADIIGLNELENSTGVEPLASIVSGLSGYNYINTGTIGTDAIKVGLIYRPAFVTPVGSFQILNSTVDARFIDTKSRPSLAQTFMVNATGAKFTVAINHFKSKGSGCDDVGDPDLGDGQGNCSQTRRAAAEALVDWLATDPTGSGDPDFIILGDLNSYAQEDTIDEIKAGSDDTVGTNDDFINLISNFQGNYAYSYTFDGAAGYLDHALANTSLMSQITGAADWHINSDEPDIFDYDTSFKPPAQDALYEVNPYRTSDHDPVVVGLIPNAPPTVDAGGPYSVPEGSSVTVTATGSDPNGDSLTYAWDLDNNGSFETSGQSVSFDASLLDGPSSYTVKVRATDPGGLSAVSSATVNVTNVKPTVSASFGANSVSCGANNATLNVSFTDPGTADTHTAVINWGDGNTQNVNPATSPFSRSHTYAAAGVYNATVTVTDDDGGVGTTTASVMVKFNTGGFLQPINADGTSVFKYNSTIPVKISFTNCNGSIPSNLAPTIRLTMISGTTPGLEINEPISTSAADTTGVMRFSSNQYIYNLATKPLPDSSATYLITVTIPSNGQTETVQFGLKP
jgi:predicted extracellular nuclease